MFDPGGSSYRGAGRGLKQFSSVWVSVRATPWIDEASLERGCGNIQYLWLVSEESFWLCACLDKRAEVVRCASSALVGRAYSALENSMLAFFEEAIWNS